MDEFFRVEVAAQTPNPQQLIWLSAHQCVCENAAIDDNVPTEEKAGEYVVKHLLAGNRGHFSPLEAPQITFNVIGFPHSVMQQITRHRIGLHFSVQSFRYTGHRIYSLGDYLHGLMMDHQDLDDKSYEMIESTFYLRPVGKYTNRQGRKYDYTEKDRYDDLITLSSFPLRYREQINQGFAEEHARGLIPFDVRQNWVMSANVRSLMHLLDLRWKADAQLEAQQLCELIYPLFETWVPAIADWYTKNRKHKARLAP